MLSNKVREIMGTDLVTAETGSSIAEVMMLMAQKDVGRVIITESELPVGIFTERDVLRRVISKDMDVKRVSVRKVMTAPIQGVSQDTHIVDALGKMYKGKFRHLVVLGAKGTIVGIVSMRRILKLAVELGRGLPETRTIGNVMSRKIVTVDAAHSIADTIAVMIQRNAVSAVVLSKGVPVGIFTERDVLTRVAVKGLDRGRTAIKEVMTGKLISASHKALVGEVLEKMYEGDFRNMPIRGDKGELVGMVSMGDVLKFAHAFDIDESVRKSWKEIEEFWDSEDQYTPG
jgi:CBS domain-containing protein